MQPFYYLVKINARIGQNLEHLPQLMHLLSSTIGASNPFWVSAPTGHTLIAGHG
jgi:hypothetical protein